MQSPQEAAGASSKKTAYMDPIACRTRSRKRTRAQMEENTEDDEPMFDILECFPILLCQYVFQHFSAKELLEVSTVNREWYKLVGEKRQAGKLRLVIQENNDKRLTRKVKNVLMRSPRKYQKIRIYLRENNLEFSLNLLAKRAGSWKYVYINTCEAISQDKWPEILQIIEPSVEELLITDNHRLVIPPSVVASVATNFTFPCLKFLKCSVRYHNVFQYFTRVTDLVYFSWYLSSVATAEATLDLLTILRNNHKLKKMRTYTLDRNFFENLHEMQFKLKKLAIKLPVQANPMQHLIAFLRTHAPTLKFLGIDLQLNQALLQFILGMPRLTKLTIDGSISAEIQELPVNTKITCLEVEGEITAGDRERIGYQTLIGALQNLKSLKCEEIDAELFLFLTHDVPALHSIETNYFNVLRVPERDVFPDIKDFKASKFREHLLEPTGDNNFAKLVRREMRKLR